ncbi:MAG: hypothetical protein LBD87_01050 [Prevotellaceae bacterium]|jgi:uncharacterized protein (TIGR02145 family)|nr:hypothetical protein [Prevotellaceae bacterium]
MRTKSFFLAMLVSVAANATVTVTPISTDYAAKKVTFKVAWTNSPSAPYNNRVWIWIDFCPISGVTPHGFSTATISNPTRTGGYGTITGLNGRGFFIEYSTTNPGSTVTATLSNAPAGKFNWCVYGSDYPPNAVINGNSYTLKGTPPFVVNGSSLGAGVRSYSGGCITSITDATGYPGIINHSFSAGAINNGSNTVLVGTTPAAITSNTAASSGGGFTYRWVRIGTSSATYTDNNAGHSFATAEINTAGSWTYYREVRDNTCATTTWNRSSGSYKLTVMNCPYTGSDLYIDATHLCRQRTSGARNWEAYIRDSRDREIYRIVLMPDGKWWLAQNVKLARYGGTNVGVAFSNCNKDECGRGYTRDETIGAWGGTSGVGENKQGVCPSGWILPTYIQYQNLFNAINPSISWSSYTHSSGICRAYYVIDQTVATRLHNQTWTCDPGNDYYGWASITNYSGCGTNLESCGWIWIAQTNLTTVQYTRWGFRDCAAYKSCNLIEFAWIHNSIRNPAKYGMFVRCIHQL